MTSQITSGTILIAEEHAGNVSASLSSLNKTKIRAAEHNDDDKYYVVVYVFDDFVKI